MSPTSVDSDLFIDVEIASSEGTRKLTGVAGPVVIIGRAQGVGVLLKHDDVSRRHAQIEVTNGGLVVRDLSTNGTYVDGKRVAGAVKMAWGQRLKVGPFTLKFARADAGSSSELTEPGPSLALAKDAPRFSLTAAVASVVGGYKATASGTFRLPPRGPAPPLAPPPAAPLRPDRPERAERAERAERSEARSRRTTPEIARAGSAATSAAGTAAVVAQRGRARALALAADGAALRRSERALGGTARHQQPARAPRSLAGGAVAAHLAATAGGQGQRRRSGSAIASSAGCAAYSSKRSICRRCARRSCRTRRWRRACFS